MPIAFVSAPGPGETDRLLAETAAQLARQRVRVAGIVKELSYESASRNGCDMKVRVLPDGPVIRITQNLGKGSDACRLDPAAIADAVARVECCDLADAQVFILNKFGPEEAAGVAFAPSSARRWNTAFQFWWASVRPAARISTRLSTGWPTLCPPMPRRSANGV